MIGDVNLFFNDYEDSANCEIEIMIANESHRRQGCGREAVEIMMAFGSLLIVMLGLLTRTLH